MNTVREALNYLLGRCDGASTLDGTGFNKFDAPIAEDLYHVLPWTFKQEQLVLKMLKKYHRQLAHGGIIYDKLIAEISDNILLSTPINSPYLDFKGGKFHLKVSKDNKDFARAIPGGRWMPEEKIWRYLNTPEFVQYVVSLKNQLELSQSAKLALHTSFKKLQDSLAQQILKKSQISEAMNIKQNSEAVSILPIKSKAYSHQIKAFEIGMALDKAGLLMEQGTGKTLPAIAIAGARFIRGDIKKLLIVAPLSVLSEWKRQFSEHANFNHDIRILNGNTLQKGQLLNGWKPNSQNLQVALINYESTWRIEEELSQWSPDMIICDESQKIKNPRAKQSKALVGLSRKTKYKLILTGTPVSQSPLDFYGQYLFLDDQILGRNFSKFRDNYAIMGGWMNKEIKGFRNLEQLAEKVHSIAYRVTKEEALDLPDTVDQTLYTTLTPSAKQMYKEMKKEAILALQDDKVTAPIILTKLLRLQQITGGFVKTDEGNILPVGDSKLHLLEEVLTDLNPSKKVVIFARFIPEIEAIMSILKKLNIKAHSLTGKVSQEARGNMINDFQNNPDTRAFVAQISTGGVGITLTSADTAIFYSTGYSLTEYEQAKARLHRIGQMNKVTYIHLLVEHTIDEEIMDILRNKREVARLVVDELKNIFLNSKEGIEMARIPKEVQKVVDELPNKTSEVFDHELKKLLKEIEEELRTPTNKDEVPWKETESSNIKKEKKEMKKPLVKASHKTPEEPITQKPRLDKSSEATDIITLKDLAQELGIEPKKIRKWLRGNLSQRSEGRWEWLPNDPELELIRNKIK